MIGRAILRLTAIAIAIAGIADPALTRDRPVPQRLTVVAMDRRAVTAAEQFQTLVRSEFDSVLRMHVAPSPASACPASGGCVLVSSGAVPARLTAGATVLGAVRIAPDEDRLIDAIDVAPRVSLNASSTLHVQLRRVPKRLEVFDEGVLVGSLTGSAIQSAGAIVTWTPVVVGARKLRVIADGDVADVGVLVDDERVAVWFHEPETTWLGTFVRRALADDMRFDVHGRTEVAPSVAITRGTRSQLAGPAVARADVVFVTAPHLLTAAQVELLERFVTRRGGSLVLLADRRPSGPVLRMFPRVLEARRVQKAASIGPLRGADLLLFEEGPGITVLQRSQGQPVIVSAASGRGRVIASGVVDAWRYRDAGTAFENYWTSLTWAAAAAAGRPLRVTTPIVAAPNLDVLIAIEVQSGDDVPSEVRAEGSFECAGERGIMRLWPGVRPGAFTALLRPNVEGRCRVRVSAGGLTRETEVLIDPDLRAPSAEDGRLAAAIAAHGGVLVTAGHEDELVARVRERLSPRHEPVTSWPLRSPWWLVAFVGCLSAEWLWRRQFLGLQ